MESPDFWDNPERARMTIAELKPLNLAIKPFEKIEAELQDLATLIELSEEAGGDEVLAEIESALHAADMAVKGLEFQAMMTKKADPCSAFLTVQAGAGGTESCDWAQMLLRMYSRWAEEHKYEIDVVDIGPGETAGIRSATLSVRGDYAYGRLRSEIGVHRLVRISPFDANSRRHTSFAAVDVIPEIDDEIDIEIRPSDIVTETFASGGPGGQHQNKTQSGVRLRHLPSGIYAESRTERSQGQNKKIAMAMLKSRLYRVEQDKRDAELAKMYDEKGEIAFGSQIRSYVLHPYQLVKDNRTDVEIGNANGVLDGNLDSFMEAYLRSNIGKNN